MPAYDSSLFVPPAPVAYVILRNPESEAAQDGVLMLLDTGADVTLLPHSAVRSVGVVPLSDKRYELIDFEGHASLSEVVRMEMIFLGQTFRGQYLLTAQEWGIVGRNVLNSIALVLDGPRLSWKEVNK